MTNYWLTFRLAHRSVGNRTYEQRYEALQATIRRHAYALDIWDEPTSFFAFTSAHAIDAVAMACKLAIAPSADMFLIREIDRQEARVCGLVLNRTIVKLMPYLRVI